MSEKTKADSIIGFAVKAGKLIYGADNIQKSKRIRLIICDQQLSQNTLNKMTLTAKNAKIKLLISNKPIEDIVFKKNVKVIALTDKQMSEAITKNLTGLTEREDQNN